MTIYSIGDKKPTLPDEGDYWIAPGAHVMGQVEIGKDVGIWFGSVLRGDNDVIKIGNETNIQENTIIHADPGCPVTIGDNCTIGHNAIIHGCTIGNNTLIGMGATILNNAKIGNNCLVGSPAKAVKELDEKTIANLTRSSKHYVDNFKKFSKDLKEIK
jgi:carbonic anhydrase/acetyltransferase-like protein (isoleucine patch superfamily)